MLLNCGAGEDSWESLDCKEIKPVNPKGNQSWIFTGRTDAEAEAPILWPPDFKKLTHWERPWCWERLRPGGEGDNRGWDGWMHHWFNGHEFEQAPGDGEGQGSLACYSPWGRKVRHDWATEQSDSRIKEHSSRFPSVLDFMDASTSKLMCPIQDVQFLPTNSSFPSYTHSF